MKRNYKKYLFVILTIITIMFSILQVVFATKEKYTSEIIISDNVSNVGQIKGNFTYEQVIETDSPFYGVTLLMGTFGKKQYGCFRVRLISELTGEAVLDKTVWMMNIHDNEPLCIATERAISGDENFALHIDGIITLPRNGATIWCDAENNLCYGIVTEYDSQIAWGMWGKRVLLITLLYVFLAFHCWLGVKRLAPWRPYTHYLGKK